MEKILKIIDRQIPISKRDHLKWKYKSCFLKKSPKLFFKLYSPILYFNNNITETKQNNGYEIHTCTHTNAFSYFVLKISLYKHEVFFTELRTFAIPNLTQKLYFSADGNYEVRYKSNVLIYPDGEVLWIPPAIYQVGFFSKTTTLYLGFSLLSFDIDSKG